MNALVFGVNQQVSSIEQEIDVFVQASQRPMHHRDHLSPFNFLANLVRKLTLFNFHAT